MQFIHLYSFYNTPLYKCHFIQSPVNEHLNCFQYSAAINTAATNSLVFGSQYTSLLSTQPEMRLASYRIPNGELWEIILHYLTKWSYQYHTPISNARKLLFNPHMNTQYSETWIFVNVVNVKKTLLDLICISLTIDDEHLFTDLLAVSSSLNYLCAVFTHFSVRLFLFYELLDIPHTWTLIPCQLYIQ